MFFFNQSLLGEIHRAIRVIRVQKSLTVTHHPSYITHHTSEPFVFKNSLTFNCYLLERYLDACFKLGQDELADGDILVEVVEAVAGIDAEPVAG